MYANEEDAQIVQERLCRLYISINDDQNLQINSPEHGHRYGFVTDDHDSMEYARAAIKVREKQERRQRYHNAVLSHMIDGMKDWRYEHAEPTLRLENRRRGKIPGKIKQCKTKKELFETIERLWDKDDNIYVAVKRSKHPDAIKLLERKEKDIPWARARWWSMSAFSMLHCIRFSAEHPGQLSYYQSAEKFERGIRTATKPGRYLTKYFGEALNSEDIKGCAALWDKASKPVEVKWARDEASMVRAVRYGPSDSCMADEALRFQGHVHPAAVYATPDIEIAYLDDGKRITARVICNVKKKRMARCYGDYARLVPAVQKLGYEQVEDALIGCRIRNIEDKNGNGHIMAYVDAGTGSGGGALHYERLDDDYWVLSESGMNTYEGYENRGVSDSCEPRMECSSCGCEIDEDNCRCAENDDSSYCEDCFSDIYVYAWGRRDQGDYAREDCVYCESDSEWYVERYANHHDVYLCTIRDKYYDSGDLIMTSRNMIHIDEAIKLDVSDSDGNDYAYCDDTASTEDGRTIHTDDVVEVAWHDGNTYVLHKDDNPDEFLPEMKDEDTIDMFEEKYNEQREVL